MTLLQFLLTFSLMILTGSPLIVGWYIVTRGEWYQLPDGKWKKYGQIFKTWSLFWEQPSRKNPERLIFYSGPQLAAKWEFLKKVRPDIYERYIPSAFHDQSLMAKPAYTVDPKDLEAIRDVLACDTVLDSQKYFRLYIREFVYMFPSCIRKPISECPTCMSSVYGSGFYWFVVTQEPNLFSWAQKEILAKLGFWVIFCLILACANKYLEQKMKL